MCNWCEAGGWKRRTCNICGRGHQATISISIATDDPEASFPYTTTDLCSECEQRGAMVMAKAHNREARESAGLTAAEK